MWQKGKRENVVDDISMVCLLMLLVGKIKSYVGNLMVPNLILSNHQIGSGAKYG